MVSCLGLRRISRCRLASYYIMLSRAHVLLLELGQQSAYGTAMAIRVRRASCEGYGRIENIDVYDGYIENTIPVKGIHRLVALDLCPPIEIMSMPYCVQRGAAQLCRNTHAVLADEVVPLSVEVEKYIPFEGMWKEDEIYGGSDDDCYTETPLAGASQLLVTHFSRKHQVLKL